MSDLIHIRGIQAQAYIGVPNSERRRRQKIEISLGLHLPLRKAGQSDDLSQTIDYFQVWKLTLKMVSQKPRKLIETLAEDIATDLLRTFPLKKIDVEIRKFILKNTRYVSVQITRKRTS